MIFGTCPRFKSSLQPICPCECEVQFYNTDVDKYKTTTGPRMVPDYVDHKIKHESGGSLLHPKIELTRPRSATFKYGTADRFNYKPTSDAPGPGNYKILGPFEKVQRASSYSTFGVAKRSAAAVKTDGDKLGLEIDPSRAFSFTQKRAPGALLLGRHVHDHENGNPGPGEYDVTKCNLFRNEKTYIMRPQSPGRHGPPERTPGYLDVSKPLIKKSFCYPHRSPTTCNHDERCDTHAYCCKFCCQLCNNRSPQRLKVADTADNRRLYGQSEKSGRPRSASAGHRPTSYTQSSQNFSTAYVGPKTTPPPSGHQRSRPMSALGSNRKIVSLKD